MRSAIIRHAASPLFISVNKGGGFISYMQVPQTFPLTGLMALGGVNGNTVAYNQPSSLFAATIFLAGALVGMGGLFITQRVNAPPRSIVMRESLKKPLLVAKVEENYTEGTAFAEMKRAPYSPMAAVVLPAASRQSVFSRQAAGSWAISAMPPALSVTGP